LYENYCPNVRPCPRVPHECGKNPSARTLGCVCADAPQRQRGHGASARTHPSVLADMGVRVDAPPSRVVTRTITDGRTDGRMDGRTMAAGASVTWTHYSVLFEVTWDKTLASARMLGCVHTDAPCPCGCQHIRVDASARPCGCECFTLGNFKKDATVRLSHGCPCGHRPTARPSVRPLSSA
jgi:hypothetical protein